jgi:hypothetical protein
MQSLRSLSCDSAEPQLGQRGDGGKKLVLSGVKYRER